MLLFFFLSASAYDMVITYNCYRLVFSWLNQYKVTAKILKVAVNNSYSKVTVKLISNKKAGAVFVNSRAAYSTV